MPAHGADGLEVRREFSGPIWYESSPVQFDASVSYDVALQELTNLGFQPEAYCGFRSDVGAGWVITGAVWKPAGQRDVFASDQRIFCRGHTRGGSQLSARAEGFPRSAEFYLLTNSVL